MSAFSHVHAGIFSLGNRKDKRIRRADTEYCARTADGRFVPGGLFALLKNGQMEIFVHIPIVW